MSREAGTGRTVSEKQSDIYMDLSQSAKKKRTYDRSNPAYKWVALQSY